HGRDRGSGFLLVRLGHGLEAALECRAKLLRELGLEPVEKRVDRAVRPGVEQTLEPETRDMREAARERLGPALDGRALLVAEPLELLLHEPAHALERGLSIALLQHGEERPRDALDEAIAELLERTVDVLARLGGVHEAGLPVLLGAPHDLVHAEARHAESLACGGIGIG